MSEAATTVLMLPGLLCDADVWEPQIASLTGVRCVVPDYRAADSIVRMAEIALAAATGPVSVVGHSMGGRVALEVARVAPARVMRLALLDTGYQARPAGAAGEHEVRERQRLVAIARTQGMRAMGSEWVRGMVHPDRLDDTALVNRILSMIERQSFEAYLCQIHALLTRPDATDVLQSVRCPTLIGCGREDFLYSANTAFLAHLDSLGIAHTARLTDGGHSWPVWQRYLSELVPRLFVKE